ncbi:MAG: ribosomal protein S18-alanine N-acetyltransferase [Deltaproteobacteria bacterium]|nr:ribosomal protein S18-alanine N-acetyltransferase [Deltaproteobacteria bacterium]
MIEILPFQSSDLEAVLDIEHQVYALPWSRASYEDLLVQDSIQMWAAKKNGRLVGYMLSQLGGDDAELHTIAVSPDMQGQGIGRMLMQHFFADAMKRRLNSLFLQVRLSNERALALYRSFGFEVVGLRKRYYSDNHEDAFVMRCSLTQD